MDIDPKHTPKASQDALKAKSRAAFQLLKTRLKAERPTNKQQVEAPAVKAKHLQGGKSL